MKQGVFYRYPSRSHQRRWTFLKAFDTRAEAEHYVEKWTRSDPHRILLIKPVSEAWLNEMDV